MFSKMTFKEKIKCILEQLIIIFVLFILSNIIISVFRTLILNLFDFLPAHINITIQNIYNTTILYKKREDINIYSKFI